MWANAVGHIMERECLGEKLKTFPEQGKFWFKPEIIWDLYKLGMSLGEINKSMTEEVVTLPDFKRQLMDDNESFSSQIDSLFVYYLKL